MDGLINVSSIHLQENKIYSCTLINLNELLRIEQSSPSCLHRVYDFREISELVRTAIIEDTKKNLSDFIGKDDYKVGVVI